MNDEITTSCPENTNAQPSANPCYKRHKHENPLSKKKKLAIQLLLQGHPDQHVADTVQVHRTTITRWRLYHPTFQTELNRQRQALWLNHADRLHSLMGRALDTLQTHMASASERSAFRAAVSIIRLGARISPPNGPTDEYELLKQYLLRERRERELYENQSFDWPVPKEHLDKLREHLIKKSANHSLPAPDPIPMPPPFIEPIIHPSESSTPSDRP